MPDGIAEIHFKSSKSETNALICLYSSALRNTLHLRPSLDLRPFLYVLYVLLCFFYTVLTCYRKVENKHLCSIRGVLLPSQNA